MKKWRVEIVNTTYDTVVVEADTDDEALLKAQSSIYRIRTKTAVTASAVERMPKGESKTAVFD